MAGKRHHRQPGSRRIRETTLKFLYACEVSRTPPGELGKVYWTLAQENDARRLTQGRHSALRRLEDQRLKVMRTLRHHEKALLAAMRPHADADSAREAWTRINDTLESVTTSLAALDEELRSIGDGSTAEPIDRGLVPVFAAYRKLPSLVDALEESAPGIPPVRAALQPLDGTLQRLRQLAGIATAIEKPGLGSKDEAVRSLHKRETRIRDEQASVQAKVQRIWDSLPAIDSAIAAAATNYRIERIETVDRCILRQAVHEMLHDTGTPPLVAIDEAIELAKAYGSTGSAAFVNGILDRILKEHKASSDEDDTASPA